MPIIHLFPQRSPGHRGVVAPSVSPLAVFEVDLTSDHYLLANQRYQHLVQSTPKRIAQAATKEEQLTPDDLRIKQLPGANPPAPPPNPLTQKGPSKPPRPPAKDLGLRFDPKKIEFFPPLEPAVPGGPNLPGQPWTITLQKPVKRVDLLTYDKQLQEAHDLLFKGEFGRARQLAEAFLAKQPGHELALHIIVVSFIWSKAFPRALDYLKKFESAASHSALFSKAQTLYFLTTGNFKSAVAAAEGWIKRESENLEPYKALIMAYMGLGDSRSALEALLRFQPTSPVEEAAIAVGQLLLKEPQKGIQILERLAQQHPTNAAIAGNLSAAMLSAHGLDNLDAAEAYADQALKANNQQAQACFTKLVALSRKNAASASLQTAIDRLEKSHHKLENRTIQIITGHDNQSHSLILGHDESDLPLSLQVDPRAVKTVLAIAYWQTRQWGKVIPLLKELLVSEWQTPLGISKSGLLAILAEAEAKTGQRELAKTHFKEFLYLHPYHAYAMQEYLNLVDQDPFLDPYFEKFVQAAEKSPTADAFLLIGQAHFHAKRLDKAEDYLSRAEKMNKDSPWIHNLLSITYANKGLFQRAVQEAGISIRLGKTDSDPYLVLLEDARQKKRFAAIKSIVERAFKEFPNDRAFIRAATMIGTQYLREYLGFVIKNGLKPLPTTSPIWKGMDLAHQWLEMGVQQQEKESSDLKLAYIHVKNVRGIATLEDLNILEDKEHLSFMVPLILALNDKTEEADRELAARLERAQNFEGGGPNIVEFYPLITKGKVDSAISFFRKFWFSPIIERQPLIAMTETIVSNPYPPQARPFVAQIAYLVADKFYTDNNIAKAISLYKKAIQADPACGEAWLGLIRSYKVMRMFKKAKAVEQQYEHLKAKHGLSL